ncbi:MAG TPA: choice-of-anchor U domain-containing protein [Candidatus Saccharimonadales bacterium]|nr:choice-of-anchor U domain-containing protein [Candidatus Saccharimonadales bacterium]
MGRHIFNRRAVRFGAVAAGIILAAVAGLASRGPARVYSATNGRIAYSLYDNTFFQVYSINADGTGQRQLTNHAYTSVQPNWSPDGSKIVYSADLNNDGNTQLFVMNADGTAQTALTNNGATNFDAHWSPDGSKIAFTIQDSGGASNLFVMDANGSGLKQLTTDGQDNAPSWKPDGSSLVFTCWDGHFDQICAINADGSGQHTVTTDQHVHETASWSPDGNKLLLLYEPTLYNDHLATMDPDGSNIQVIATTGTDTNHPAWSPDGSKIVFEDTGVGSSPTSIYYINADGSGQTPVTPDDSFNSQYASWQPVTTTDNDNDGSPNATENNAPNSGDANGDGVLDAAQPNVTSLVSPVSGTYGVLQSSCGSGTAVSLTAAPAGYKDAAFNYPAGLMAFTLHCGASGTTATVTQYYYGLAASGTFVLRKYNATTHTYQTMPGAAITQATVGGQSAVKVTYQITDGGPFDQDGTANGLIVDPVGLAQPSISAPNTGLGGTAR